MVKISVIGVGMRSHAGVAQRMFQTLAEKGINIQVISTSEIKVSVLIAEEYTELALRALHTAYGLDAADAWTRAATRDARGSTRCGGAGASSSARELAIMGGAMTWVSERHLVAAMSNAGGFGVHRLRRDVARAARRRNRRHLRADRQAVRRQSDHHAPAARRS